MGVWLDVCAIFLGWCHNCWVDASGLFVGQNICEMGILVTPSLSLISDFNLIAFTCVELIRTLPDYSVARNVLKLWFLTSLVASFVSCFSALWICVVTFHTAHAFQILLCPATGVLVFEFAVLHVFVFRAFDVSCCCFFGGLFLLLILLVGMTAHIFHAHFFVLHTLSLKT